MDVDVALVMYDDQTLEDASLERSYVGLYKFLWQHCAEQPVEGWIFAHKGKYYKVICEKKWHHPIITVVTKRLRAPKNVPSRGIVTRHELPSIFRNDSATAG